MRFPPFQGRRRSPIGIDVGRRKIKAVQMRRAATGKYAVESVVSIVRTATDPSPTLTVDEACRLAAILQRRGFAGNQVVLAAPPDQVVQALLELPPITNAAIPLHSLARNELCASRRLDPTSAEVAHWQVPAPARGGRATYVMAAAHRHTDAQATVSAFTAAGLDVAAIDLNVWALARGCATAATNNGGIVPILDLGWGGATLVLMLRDTVVFHRTVEEAGLATLASAAALATRLGTELVAGLLDHVPLALGQPAQEPDRRAPELSADLLAQLQDAVRAHCERLAEDVQASISYVAQRYADTAPTQILLVGGGAALPGVADALGSALGAECRAVAPANCPPAATLAAGLALYPTAAAQLAAPRAPEMTTTTNL